MKKRALTIKLYLSFRQQKGRRISFTDLYDETAKEKMPTIKMFNYLKKHQDLIPDHFSDYELLFLSTKHIDNDGGPSIYCLYKGKDKRWHEKLCFIGSYLYVGENRQVVVYRN